MTPEEAWQEEAYDEMVAEILASHKEEIIDGFVSERMGSYYRNHPDLTVPAEAAIEEARNLIDVSPTASLVFSASAIEITLRDVLLKPVPFGMVHDENTGPLIADLVVGNNQFRTLLFTILEDYGLNVTGDKRPGSSKTLWEEISEIQKTRNNILHRGEKATHEFADTSLKIADAFLYRLYPLLRQRIAGT
jgi:hypothetical protein